MTRKKVLVTGGAGFIGSTVVHKLLSRGYLVTVLDNLSVGSVDNIPNHHKALRLVAGDVRDFEMVSAVVRGHEYVIHMAAQAFIPMSYDLPVKCASVNALGSLHVFKACLNYGVKRIVHISSSEVYGPAMYQPMDEKHPLNPLSTYAVSKAAADQWAQTMAFEHKLPVVILRPFNTFGPRDSLPRFIPEMIRQCIKEPAIKVGNINTSRDYSYVDDIARAAVFGLEKEGIDGEIANFGCGKALRMCNVLEMISKITGSQDKEIIHDSARLRPHDVDFLMSSTTKAYRILGWRPEVDFADGLKRTLDWYMTNGQSWNYEKRGWNWRY